MESAFQIISFVLKGALRGCYTLSSLNMKASQAVFTSHIPNHMLLLVDTAAALTVACSKHTTVRYLFIIALRLELGLTLLLICQSKKYEVIWDATVPHAFSLQFCQCSVFRWAEMHGGLCTTECNWVPHGHPGICVFALDIQCVWAYWIIFQHTKY